MNEVPETGSIPVSPMTLTAIAPSKNCDHSNECNPHEYWDVLKRPLVPSLTLDELISLLTGEGAGDVSEYVDECRSHLQESIDTTT